MQYIEDSEPSNVSPDCACFLACITNDGECLQEAVGDEEAGQCQCKPNVYGRKCDQCKPGFWGFRLDPPGDCKCM